MYQLTKVVNDNNVEYYYFHDTTVPCTSRNIFEKIAYKLFGDFEQRYYIEASVASDNIEKAINDVLNALVNMNLEVHKLHVYQRFNNIFRMEIVVKTNDEDVDEFDVDEMFDTMFGRINLTYRTDGSIPCRLK